MTNHELLLIREQTIEVKLISLTAKRKVVKEQACNEHCHTNMYMTMASYELPRLDYQIVELEQELKEVRKKIFRGTL